MSQNNSMTDIDRMRLEVSSTKERTQKSELGQFFTNSRVARFMAQMFDTKEPHIRLLDPGAGIGVLTAMFVETMCKKRKRPVSIDVVAIEIDDSVIPYLSQTLETSALLCNNAGINFTYRIVHSDFLEYGLELLNAVEPNLVKFNTVIMNPPYKKINLNSRSRQLLRDLGIESPNLYTGFVAVAKRLMTDSGQLVAITPRSFCNGTYYEKFRYDFLADMSFRKIHLFESRKEAFSEDDVLQENIIYLADKSKVNRKVSITTSLDQHSQSSLARLDYNELVHPDDKQKFIRLPKDQIDLNVKSCLESVSSTLQQLNIQVSTGKIVDFRTKEHLRTELTETTLPLIYPLNFSNGFIEWPIFETGKPIGIELNDQTSKMVLPRGNYVLVRRFSSKEEPKRIVPAIYDGNRIQVNFVGFENHVNYFHINNSGLSIELAKGLAIYLSSSIVDRYFRQFNGHTQVNVGDLKSLPYPTYDQIIRMGLEFLDVFPNQAEIDQVVQNVLGIDIVTDKKLEELPFG